MKIRSSSNEVQFQMMRKERKLTWKQKFLTEKKWLKVRRRGKNIHMLGIRDFKVEGVLIEVGEFCSENGIREVKVGGVLIEVEKFCSRKL
ncbi:hypothetical protein FRX31_008101, partial [Thalictrum thalictroides]